MLQRLREAILEGTLAPGASLNQVQLAADFGSSRGPVRAALARLEQEGLVRYEPYRGTFVTELDRRTVQEIYGVRSALETYAIRQAAGCCQEADLAYLAAVVERMQIAAGTHDVNEVVKQEQAFHRRLVELAGNGLLLATWTSIQTRLLHALLFRHRNVADISAVADSHLHILAALKMWDADQAAIAVAEHIEEACADLLATRLRG